VIVVLSSKKIKESESNRMAIKKRKEEKNEVNKYKKIEIRLFLRVK